MKTAYTHVGNVWDGAVVCFPNSSYYWFKCCDDSGIGGVVNLQTGLYIRATESELQRHGLDVYVTVVAMHVDELYDEDGWECK